MANSEVFNIVQLLGAIVLLLGTASCYSSLGGTCRIPEGPFGKCIRMVDCPKGIKALKHKYDNLRHHDYKSYYIKVACGGVDGEHLTCCEMPTEKDVAEDVSQHPNLSLLRHDICGPVSRYPDSKENNTGLFEFPWMALPLKKSGLNYVQNCAGSIISDRYVLIAAHCIKEIVPDIVRIGDHDLHSEIDCEEQLDGKKKTKICAPKPQDISIEEIVVHPDYVGMPFFHRDLALLRLSEPVDFTSDAVRPICLPIGLSEQTRNLVGKDVDIAGWKKTVEDSKPNKLVKASVPLLKNKKCNYCPPISSVKHVCVGRVLDSGDPCAGDSYGPLTYVDKVGGIKKTLQYAFVTRVPEECGTYRATVGTKVGHYMKWILDNLKP